MERTTEQLLRAYHQFVERRFPLQFVPEVPALCERDVASLTVWNKGSEILVERRATRQTCTENRATSIAAHARLRGVEFRAVGNEPGWLLVPRRQSSGASPIRARRGRPRLSPRPKS